MLCCQPYKCRLVYRLLRLRLGRPEQLTLLCWLRRFSLLAILKSARAWRTIAGFSWRRWNRPRQLWHSPEAETRNPRLIPIRLAVPEHHQQKRLLGVEAVFCLVENG